jgi:hypothetical protein
MRLNNDGSGRGKVDEENSSLGKIVLGKDFECLRDVLLRKNSSFAWMGGHGVSCSDEVLSDQCKTGVFFWGDFPLLRIISAYFRTLECGKLIDL